MRKTNRFTTIILISIKYTPYKQTKIYYSIISFPRETGWIFTPSKRSPPFQFPPSHSLIQNSVFSKVSLFFHNQSFSIKLHSTLLYISKGSHLVPFIFNRSIYVTQIPSIYLVRFTIGSCN